MAEAISWAGALRVLGVTELDAAAAERTAGAVLKYAEDLRRVREAGFAGVLGELTELVRREAALRGGRLAERRCATRRARRECAG